MSPFGPGVLPERAPSVADFLEGLRGGFLSGEALADRRRQRRWQQEEQRRQRQEWGMADEDRNRYLRQLQAAEEAQPGAQQRTSFEQQPSYKKYVDLAATKAPGAAGRLVFQPRFATRFHQTATGAVIDREAAARETLADYLQRYGAQAQVRRMFPTPSEQTAHEKYVSGQEQEEATYQRALRAYPDLQGLGRTTAIRIYLKREDRRFANLNPPPARPRAPGSPSGADRRTTALQRELDSAQRDVQSLEGRPEYGYWTTATAAERARQPAPTLPANVTQRNYQDWLGRYQRARGRLSRAQRDVNAALHGGHEPAPPSARLRPLPPLPEE